MEVIGFKRQLSYIRRVLERGELAHAYLFSGPEMIGKRLFAFELAARASESNLFPESDPNIRVIAPDIENDKTHIPIEDIRNLKSFLSLTPLRGKRRIAIVDDAHRMTQEASNSFLKILEEPPHCALIVLLSSQPDILPRTIVSRCQEIRFMPHRDKTVEEFLRPYKLPKEDAELIKALAGGRIGWLVRIMSENGLKRLKMDIEEFKTIARQGITERLLFSKKVAERDDRAELADIWLRWVRSFGTDPDKYRLVLKRLLELRATLTEPQFNARLALESFFLSF